MPASVLIVEDQELQRDALTYALQKRHFLVHSAANAAQAREHFQAHGKTLDVAVLDMRLEDPQARGVTGADLGIEAREYLHNKSPQFLINSAYQDLDHYHLAAKLGAAAYLTKKESVSEVVMHVRALALRHQLLKFNVQSDSILNRIVQYREYKEAVFSLCREWIKPQLMELLGKPFLMTFQLNTHQTYQVASHESFAQIQPTSFNQLNALMLSRYKSTEPFRLDFERIQAPEAERRHYRPLHGTQFLPVLELPEFKFHLGIIPEDTNNMVHEDHSTLCKIISRYYAGSLATFLARFSAKWAERHGRTEEAIQKTSVFCLSMAREHDRILQKHEHSTGQTPPSLIRDIRKLSNNFYETGTLLDSLLQNHTYSRQPAAERPIQPVLDMLKENFHADQDHGYGDLRTYGACNVPCNPQDLLRTLSMLVAWMAHRFEHCASGPCWIQLQCTEDELGSHITLEDRSKRLPRHIREQLFEPFSGSTISANKSSEILGSLQILQLYLAKVLIEFKNQGRIEDHTDEMDTNDGHRFIISFSSSHYSDPERSTT